MKTIQEILEEKKDSILGLEKFLYANPEIEMEEFKAKAKFVELLKQEGFETEDVEGLPTAFVARKSSGEGPRIGICAEYDALPALGHACGHNLIGAMSYGAAVVLAEWLMQSGHKGSVCLLGTPAEETGRGKPGMLAAGCFKNVDVAMMAHPMKSTTLMSKLVNLEGYDITFHGRAMHAAEAPWNGVNALDAAAIFYNAVAMLRQQLRDGSRVHMIVTDGGDAVNIIPERAALRVEIRHSDFKYFRELVNKVLAVAEQAAKAAGCTVDIEMFEPPIYCMKNNRPMIDLFKRHMLDAGITEYVEEAATGGGCTDMGNVSQEVPSAIEQMYKVIGCLAETGADILAEPKLLDGIKAAFAAEN